MKTSNGSIGNASFGVGGANTHSTKTNLQAPFPPKGSLSLTPTVEARRTTISTSESPNQDEVESIIPAIAKLFEQNNAVNSITKQVSRVEKTLKFNRSVSGLLDLVI